MKVKPANRSGEVVLKLDRKDERLMEAAAETTPFKIKNILVPIDFSECATKALRYAIPLAQEHHAAVTLIHVVAPIYAAAEYGLTDYVALQADLRKSGQTEISKLAAREIPDGVSSHTVVVVGSPTEEILTAAKTLPADLIVVSTHGRTGLKHVVLGSVAERIVRYAPCPVLVVREREREFV